MSGTGRPVVDYDHHSSRYNYENAAAIGRRLRHECPVAWSERYEGFWVVTGYEDVCQVARDDATFSSQHDVEGTGHGYGGVDIPPVPFRWLPLELDPPEHLKFRQPLNPTFAPSAVNAWHPFLEEVVHGCLDAVSGAGEIDFVQDLANPVTGKFVLALAGIAPDDWVRWTQPFHDAAAYPAGTPESNAAMVGIGWVVGQLFEIIPQRRMNPGDDLISTLANAEVDGEPMADQQILETMLTVLAGGVDTTVALLTNSLWWLCEHPADRQRLIADPGLLASAGEEFLRYFTPVPHLARTVTHDTELGGQRLCAKDRLLISWASANRDPDVFERPDEVILDRFPNRHTSFGVGGHRCVGSNFARLEFRTVVGAVLERFPDAVIDRSRAKRYESVGAINGWAFLPANFRPRPPQQAWESKGENDQ